MGFTSNFSMKIMSTKQLFYSTNEFPHLKSLEDNWSTIASEIPYFDPNRTYPRRTNNWPTGSNKSEFENYLASFKSEWCEGWQGNHEWFNFPLIYNDTPIDKADVICPKTTELLKCIGGFTIVGFSLLAPHGRLVAHTDATGQKFNTMAGNLLLTENTDASVYVLDNQHLHTQGNLVIFDATHVHYADNNDSKPRVILYADFKIPM